MRFQNRHRARHRRRTRHRPLHRAALCRGGRPRRPRRAHGVRARGDRAADRRGGRPQRSPCPADITEPGAAEDCVARTERELGPVDILVNNAGIFVWRPFLKLSPEDWDRVIATNLTGAAAFCRAVLPGNGRAPARADRQRRLHPRHARRRQRRRPERREVRPDRPDAGARARVPLPQHRRQRRLPGHRREQEGRGRRRARRAPGREALAPRRRQAPCSSWPPTTPPASPGPPWRSSAGPTWSSSRRAPRTLRPLPSRNTLERPLSGRVSISRRRRIDASTQGLTRLPGAAGRAARFRPGARPGRPTADEIVAKYVKTIGGMEKIEAVKTLKRTGKFTGGGGFEAKVLEENKRPDLVRQEFTFQGMTGVTAYDGKAGWKIEPWQGKKDPEPLGEEELKGDRRGLGLRRPARRLQGEGQHGRVRRQRAGRGHRRLEAQADAEERRRPVLLHGHRLLRPDQDRDQAHRSAAPSGSPRPRSATTRKSPAGTCPTRSSRAARAARTSRRSSTTKIEANVPMDDAHLPRSPRRRRWRSEGRDEARRMLSAISAATASAPPSAAPRGGARSGAGQGRLRDDLRPRRAQHRLGHDERPRRGHRRRARGHAPDGLRRRGLAAASGSRSTAARRSSRSSTSSPCSRSAPSRSIRRIRRPSGSAPASPGRATASRSATASTSPSTAARTGRTWASATPSASRRSSSIPRRPTPSTPARRASSGATATSAASTRRPTAARPGRRC